jgi:hypothetical protein
LKLLLLLVASLSFGLDTKYTPDRFEHGALIYIYGYKITSEIEAIAFITDDVNKIHDWQACYFHKKIWINASQVSAFRARLALVHEGTHYYQQEYLHQRELSDTGFGAYHMTTYEPMYKLPVEKEAELVRYLAMFYARDAMGDEIAMEPVFIDDPELPDTTFVREQLWLYLQMYVQLSKPENWALGAL